MRRLLVIVLLASGCITAKERARAVRWDAKAADMTTAEQCLFWQQRRDRARLERESDLAELATNRAMIACGQASAERLAASAPPLPNLHMPQDPAPSAQPEDEPEEPVGPDLDGCDEVGLHTVQILYVLLNEPRSLENLRTLADKIDGHLDAIETIPISDLDFVAFRRRFVDRMRTVSDRAHQAADFYERGDDDGGRLGRKIMTREMQEAVIVGTQFSSFCPNAAKKRYQPE